VDRKHLDAVRTRFTRTAQDFARFALAARAGEAERLACLAAPRGNELALDLACGPGTFTRAFAARVRQICCLDLTPAMLDQARAAVARAALANVAFACGDANALPFAGAALDLAVCGYSFHHFLDPARVIAELGRVVRCGGRVAVVDIVVPEGANPEWNNRVERTRDPSHPRTLTAAELMAMFQAAGLLVFAHEIAERLRQFDQWMENIGTPPGTPAYIETRRMMEAAMPGDRSGFRPRFVRTASDQAVSAQGEIEFVQTSLFLVAEKR
jgi:ubiquinone/menaquinone biosynthesis C-methylase UbiE